MQKFNPPKITVPSLHIQLHLIPVFVANMHVHIQDTLTCHSFRIGPCTNIILERRKQKVLLTIQTHNCECKQINAVGKKRNSHAYSSCSSIHHDCLLRREGKRKERGEENKRRWVARSWLQRMLISRETPKFLSNLHPGAYHPNATFFNGFQSTQDVPVKSVYGFS